MLRSYFLSKQWASWAWGGLAVLLASVSSQVYIEVLLNNWYKDFYDLLEKASDREISEFWLSIKKFYQLAFTYITIAVFSSFFARHWVFRWRQAMTFFYVPMWIGVEREIEGSSQRIQEDTQKFAVIVENLGLELFESILKVFAFVSILWTLSGQVGLELLKDIPGSLVWIALICSFGGMIISFLVGIKLPGIQYNIQKVEAAYRKHLVYGEDHKDIVSVPTIRELFLPLRSEYFRLFLHYSYFDIWRIFYIQTTVLIPFIAMAPGLFSGALTLGVVIQTSNAFDKVIGSFSYFIRSWTTITELLSVIKRLREFEIAIGYRKGEGQTAEDVQHVSGQPASAAERD